MNTKLNGFELWLFRQLSDEVEYLVLDGASTAYGDETAIGCIPNGFIEGEPVEALLACVDTLALSPLSLWFPEHAFTTYDRRHNGLTHITVFAAEVEADDSRASASYGAWCSRKEAELKIFSRGTNEGLYWLRRYITEVDPRPAALRLWERSKQPAADSPAT